MDYQAINPDEAVDQLLAQHAREANLAAVGFELDCAAMEFCQTLRALDGKEADTNLYLTNGKAQDGTDIIIGYDQVSTLADEANAKCADRIKRMTTPLDDKHLAEERAAQVTTWLASWEAEHAQHGLLIDLAESPEQVEASTVAQLYIEGKVTAARKQVSPPKPKR